MIAFFISVILSISSFFFKKSKAFLLLFFTFIWVLFGWNYYNADLGMYKCMYNVSISELGFLKYEGGYNFLMYCGKFIGLSFQEFFIVLSGCILLLLFRFFYIFSKFPALLVFCFFWIFFPLEYVIFRNFLAFSIVLQGFISVFRNEKYCNQKFVFFVIIASTIHISSLFYLIFLLAFNENEIKIKKIVYWVASLLFLTIIFHHYVFILLSVLHKSKVEFYKTCGSLFLTYSLAQIGNLIVVKYFMSLGKNEEIENKLNRAEIIILNINTIMLFLIVVYFEMAVFVRILFNISIINLLFILNKLITKENKIIPKLVFIIYLIFWFFLFIFSVRENTIISLFNSNLILK